jgi:hypothetical protein
VFTELCAGKCSREMASLAAIVEEAQPRIKVQALKSITVTPRSKGGTDDIENLLTACFECNNGKSDKLVPEPPALSQVRVEAAEVQSTASTPLQAFSDVPSITIFVRHHKDCPRKADHFHKACRCRKRLRWCHNGERKDVSAKTRSWAQAEIVRRRLEAHFKAANEGVGREPNGVGHSRVFCSNLFFQVAGGASH